MSRDEVRTIIIQNGVLSAKEHHHGAAGWTRCYDEFTSPETGAMIMAWWDVSPSGEVVLLDWMADR